jgi:NADPH-dependent 2,4-dienoyl-CoA reductase/sulfur reductase-like enzyme
MCVDGWIPVDPLTLETAYPDVYAVGDVASVGTPKAGVFSERQASVVADQLIARHGQAGPPSSGPAAYGAGSTATGPATKPARNAISMHRN